MTTQNCAPVGITINGVVELAGGRRAVAEACQVTVSAVQQWTRIPNRHLKTVAALSKLSWSVLRPDLFEVAP